MRRLALAVTVAACAFAAAPAPLQAANLVNAGFETGDLTGWKANPIDLAGVVSSLDTDYSGTFLPYSGQFFGVVSSGNEYFDGGGTAILYQSIFLKAGETVSGVAAWVSGEAL